MKQVIELLEKARHELVDIAITTIQDFERELTVKDCINKVLSILKAPRWETPEQREERTGEPWPDDWAVYFYNGYLGWQVDRYLEYRKRITEIRQQTHSKVLDLVVNDRQYPCVCATEAGKPPDDWKPETQKD